jgi:hypothetical protein
MLPIQRTTALKLYFFSLLYQPSRLGNPLCIQVPLQKAAVAMINGRLLQDAYVVKLGVFIAVCLVVIDDICCSARG